MGTLRLLKNMSTPPPQKKQQQQQKTNDNVF